MTTAQGDASPPSQLGTELGASYRAKKHSFMGIGLSCLTDEQFVDAVRQALATRSRLTVSFINPDYVLRGQLVDVEGKESQMRTSLSRDDTGAGACEILLAESARIMEP